jgi:hypothetical protein
MNVNILKEKVQVKLTGKNDTINLEEFEAKDVKIIKNNNNNTKEEDIEAIEELKNLED